MSYLEILKMSRTRNLYLRVPRTWGFGVQEQDSTPRHVFLIASKLVGVLGMALAVFGALRFEPSTPMILSGMGVVVGSFLARIRRRYTETVVLQATPQAGSVDSMEALAAWLGVPFKDAVQILEDAVVRSFEEPLQIRAQKEAVAESLERLRIYRQAHRIGTPENC